MRYSLKKALVKHKRRSARAQAQDNRMRARHIVRSRRNLKKWFKAPNQYDIWGIDAFRRRRIIRRVKRRLRIRSRPASRRFGQFLRATYKRRPIIRQRHRAPGLMNLGLQTFRIGKLIKSRGIARDLIDVRARMDKTLSYRENKRNLMGQINLMSPRHSLEMERGAIRNMQAAYRNWEKNRNKWG